MNSCLADGHQHDASEFQLFLLDALHEDTNQVLTAAVVSQWLSVVCRFFDRSLQVTKRISFEQNYKGGAQIMNDAKDYEKKSRLFSCSPVNKIFNVCSIEV